MFRQLLTNYVNQPKDTPDYIIVGDDSISGTSYQGYYTILNKTTMNKVVTGTPQNNNEEQANISWSLSTNQYITKYEDGNGGIKASINTYANGTTTISATINNKTVTKQVYANFQFPSGSFTINSKANWDTFVSNVNNGTTYSGYTIELNTDLTLSETSSANIPGIYNSNTRSGTPFMGIFNGNFHTITVSHNFTNVDSTERVGAIFGYCKGATIKNLFVVGSLTSTGNGTLGSIGACQKKTKIKNLFVNLDVTNTTKGACAGLGGIAYNHDTSNTTENISTEYNDVVFVGNVKAYANAGLITYDYIAKSNRITAIGTTESTNTSNPVKTIGTLCDIVKSSNPDLYINDIFSKGVVKKGLSNVRCCIQVPYDIYDGATINRILDLNDYTNSATNLCTVAYQSTNTLNNAYTINPEPYSSDSGGWSHKSGTKTTFASLCETDTFNNSNWIKGKVGTSIINNTFATNFHVLEAAKNESYYGPTS